MGGLWMLEFPSISTVEVCTGNGTEPSAPTETLDLCCLLLRSMHFWPHPSLYLITTHFESRGLCTHGVSLE